jgi:hypothetical protein
MKFAIQFVKGERKSTSQQASRKHSLKRTFESIREKKEKNRSGMQGDPCNAALIMHLSATSKTRCRISLERDDPATRERDRVVSGLF